MPVDPSKVIAIDVHVHAEVSCHDPEDPVMAKFFDAASAYFKADRKRPTIPETIDILSRAEYRLLPVHGRLRERDRRQADQQLRDRRTGGEE